VLLFTPKTWAQLQLLSALSKERMSNFEFHGFGKVTLLGQGDVLCSELSLPKQEATAAHIESNGNCYAEWATELFRLEPGMTKEAIVNANEELQSWRLWWHYHGSMSAKYSTEDEGTLTDLAMHVKSWFFGLVFNDDMATSVYVAQGVPIPLFADWGTATPQWPLEEKDAADLAAIFDCQVQKKAVVNTPALKPGWTPTYIRPGLDEDGYSCVVETDKDLRREFGDFELILPKKSSYLEEDCMTCKGSMAWGRKITKRGKKNGYTSEQVKLCWDCVLPQSICDCTGERLTWALNGL